MLEMFMTLKKRFREEASNVLKFANIDSNIQGLSEEHRQRWRLCTPLFVAGHRHVSWWVERPGPVGVACPVTYEKLYWPSNVYEELRAPPPITTARSCLKMT